MKKEIIVTIVTTRRKSQRFTFTIDDGSGPDMAVKEFYTRSYTAKRGALRQLDAERYEEWTGDYWISLGPWKTPDGREIVFRRKKN